MKLFKKTEKITETENFNKEKDVQKVLNKNRPLFFAVVILLIAAALWHGFYVYEAYAATHHYFLLKNYFVLALGCLGLVAFSGITLFNKTYGRIAVWFFSLLMMGFVSMKVMPGLSAPDEPVHYISAYYYANLLTMQTPDDEEGRVFIRMRDIPLENLDYKEKSENRIFGTEMNEETYYINAHFKELYPEKESGRTVSSLPRMQSSPAVYLPQALGIAAAVSFGMSPEKLVAMGRIFNFLAFSLLILFAVMRMPVGREIMMAVSLLPMTVHLASSMSYDAMLIALSFVFISEVLHIAKSGEPFTAKDAAILAVSFICLAPCKIVYSVLIFLLLIIPVKCFGSRKNQLLCLFLCITGAVVTILLINGRIIGTYAAESVNELSWAGGEEGYTFMQVLHDPIKAVKLIYDTVCYNGSYYFITLFGGYLGNSDPTLDVPFFIILILAASLFLLSLRYEGEDDTIKLYDKCVIGADVLIISACLMGSMLIAYTPLSSAVVCGVQGRYLIPVLPAALLVLKGKTLVLTKDLRDELIFIFIAADVYAFLRLYSMICLHI